MAGRRASRRTGRRKRTGLTREWIGGRLSPPLFIQDRDDPYRPELVMWLEQPSGLVVGEEVVATEEAEGAVARVLLAALERPFAGPPRKPPTIRVAEASIAAEVRAALGDSIPVVVAPTPELDDHLESMLELMPDSEDQLTYLEGGRIDPSTIATDGQVLRMDIPELGVEGACVSIIGYLGQSLGIIVFSDLAAYESFGLMAADPLPRQGRIDLGTDWLALNFEHEEDLPSKMRCEVAAYGWPVAGEDAYPRVERRERDGASRPLVERDLEIAAACASSLSAFFGERWRLFEGEDFEPVCESFFDQDDLEVRFTVPYEAFPLFEPIEDLLPEPARPAGGAWGKVGRNDPCPCGSGRKYKKCTCPSKSRSDLPPGVIGTSCTISTHPFPSNS